MISSVFLAKSHLVPQAISYKHRNWIGRKNGALISKLYYVHYIYLQFYIWKEITSGKASALLRWPLFRNSKQGKVSFLHKQNYLKKYQNGNWERREMWYDTNLTIFIQRESHLCISSNFYVSKCIDILKLCVNIILCHIIFPYSMYLSDPIELFLCVKDFLENF